MVTQLLNARADVDAWRGKHRVTPLQVAASTANMGVCEALLAGGADANYANREGTTAWDLARNNKLLQVMLERVGAQRGAGTTGSGRLVLLILRR